MQAFRDLLNDPHLNRFAGLFAIAMAPGWRRLHPEVASIRGRLDRVAQIIRGGDTFDIGVFTSEWVKMITDIVTADPSLSYGSDDLDWLFGLLDDQNHARTAIMLLLATASTSPRWYTCDDLAKVSGKSAVWWRKQAALPGNPWLAITRGNTHLFHELILRAHGINTPPSLQIEEA